MKGARKKCVERPGRAEEMASLTYANRRLVEAIGGRLGIHDSDLPDLVQRVVVTMFRRHQAINLGSERGFLAQVTRLEARHMLRDYRRRPENGRGELSASDQGTHADQADDHVSRQREIRRLLLLFAGIAEPMRDVWLSHVIDGVSCHEVAAAMGLPLGTVKSRLRRVWARVLQNSELCQSAGGRDRNSRAAMDPVMHSRALVGRSHAEGRSRNVRESNE